MEEPSASLTLLPDFWLHTPVASFQNKRAQAKALQEMKSRIAELQARITKDVDYAFESLLQAQPDLSLKMEGELEEVLRMAELIEGELDEASGISELERLDRRIEFIEDRFEELEAELYSHPRRRRKRRPNLFDFFRQAAGAAQRTRRAKCPMPPKPLRSSGSRKAVRTRRSRKPFA